MVLIVVGIIHLRSWGWRIRSGSSGASGHDGRAAPPKSATRRRRHLNSVALDWLLPVPRRWGLSTSRPRPVRNEEPAELTFQQPQQSKHVPCIKQLYNGTRRFNYITLNHKTKACLSYTQAGPHSLFPNL
jgi:hypothetical protein